MKKFIKDNIVLALGISLPLLLVLLFILAGTLPKYLVADPQYDLLFSEAKYNSYIEFEVQEQKLYMKAHPDRFRYEKSVPQLYRYSAATGKTQKITFQLPDMSHYEAQSAGNNLNNTNTNIVITVDPTKLPSAEQAQDTSKIVSEINKNNNNSPFMVPVTEVAQLEINASPVAPDGYRFSSGSSGYSGGDLFLFGVGSYDRNRGPVLSKNGKNVPIDYDPTGEQYYQSSNFIGWVTP